MTSSRSVEQFLPQQQTLQQQRLLKDPSHEWVLLVPPKLTNSSYAILVEAECVFRPWHLEGRFGSRTHRHVNSCGSDTEDGSTSSTTTTTNYRIAIPVLSDAIVQQQAQCHPKLQELLQKEGVELNWKQFVPSNRAVRELPYFDARIHPERQPRNDIHSKIMLPKNNKAFTYMDLFAGIGGFATALDALGGQCLMASEIDDACRRTYSYNFSKAPLLGDIYKIHNKHPQLPQQPGTLDILVGGFPCQPFSALGRQPGLDCPKSGNLFLEIVRLLKVCQPKAFLLENVPGLLTMKDTFPVILQSLKDVGYQVTYEVCNARGLTATSRKRLFIVGLRGEDARNGNKDDHVAPFEFPFVPDLQFTAQNVIDYTYNELSSLERQLLPISDDQLQQLQKSKKWKPAHMAWPNTVCDTIVSHYGNSIGRGHSQLVPYSATILITNAMTDVKTTNPRLFSPRECLRIMGFPHSYQLPPKDSPIQGDRAYLKEQYRMIGNAVCPPLIAALVGAILDRIIPFPPDERKCDGDNKDGMLQTSQRQKGEAQTRDQSSSSSSTLAAPPAAAASSEDQVSDKNQQSIDNWIECGRQVAVDLAYQAIKRPRQPPNECKTTPDDPLTSGSTSGATSGGNLHGRNKTTQRKRKFDSLQ